MSFINPITDFDIAMGQQEPKVAQAIFELKDMFYRDALRQVILDEID